MAELLIEILSEEIPAGMQGAAETALTKLLASTLDEAALAFDTIDCFSTPRRLIARVDGLPARQPDTREERRGPKIDAPERAIEGFLKSAGIERGQAEERETKNGVYLFAVVERQGRRTAEIIAEALPEIIGRLKWPKSMRWGDGDLSWVRPLHSVLCLFDGAPVVAEIGDGLVSGDQTRGHRFMAPEVFTVSNFDEYKDRLEAAKVMIDADERRASIVAGLEAFTTADLEVKADPGLLHEVAGLAEWPVVLMGDIDQAFMELPPEVLVSSMRKHQKYFAVIDPRSGEMVPRFAVVANIETADGGSLIREGNERVLKARLADAKFFWDQDRGQNLADRVGALDKVVFHAKLGSVGGKVDRIQALARNIAGFVPGAEAAPAQRAALLAKADLTTEMVKEFPDLQGVMGRYYALAAGETEAIAAAVAEHYAPLGPADDCPSAPLSVTVALADKIDTLVGFFAIDEKPTGSKDPFALRRAALGVIRLITENGLRLPLEKIFAAAAALHGAGEASGLLDFIALRLKAHLREKGVRHDLIDAVFGLDGEDDLVRLLARVEALQAFLASDDGTNLLIAYRRASNIVKIEEKKDGVGYDGAVKPELIQEPDERVLFERLEAAAAKAADAVGGEDFGRAMAAIAELRQPVDRFFDHVTVNCEDRELRANRLRLLARIRVTLHAVADFSRIEG